MKNSKDIIFILAVVTLPFVALFSPTEADALPQTVLEATGGREKDVEEEKEQNSTTEDILSLAAKSYDVPLDLLKGIARAESSFGTAFHGCDYSHNWWGLKAKPAEECNPWLKKYETFEEAAMDAARILRTYYLDEGKDTPEKIVMKYVGHYSQNWIDNVKGL